MQFSSCPESSLRDMLPIREVTYVSSPLFINSHGIPRNSGREETMVIWSGSWLAGFVRKDLASSLDPNTDWNNNSPKSFNPASTASARVLASPNVLLGYSMKYQRISDNSLSVSGNGKSTGGAVSTSPVPVKIESCSWLESAKSIICSKSAKRASGGRTKIGLN